MRMPRIKPDDHDTWHHCYNRIAGIPTDLPFGPVEKEYFIKLLHRLARFYSIRVAAYQVMSNHFHLLLLAPAQAPSLDDTASRFRAFHYGKRYLDPSSTLCGQWQSRLRDVSWFMAHLQRLFTLWYNKSRSTPRRGTLWAGRFKNTVLESGSAVWNCWKYIEMNPVRAGLVSAPALYRFSSFGHWAQTGRHPFQQALSGVVVPTLSPLLPADSLAALYAELDQQLASAAIPDTAPDYLPLLFSTHISRRVRHWVDGLVIGSELFVRSIMARSHEPTRVAKHRLTPAIGSGTQPFFAWQRVRSTHL